MKYIDSRGLKRCPECGGRAEIIKGTRWFILCPDCGRETDYYDKKEYAKVAWNYVDM